MTYFYKTYSWGNNSTQGISEETRTLWEHIAKKENWRIVQLPNGFFQAEYKDPNDEEKWIDVTRRETLESCEAAIDGSIDHYSKKLDFLKGPKVVKTFK
ncbi:MAG: hypothetical protein HKN86_05875 [Acidimicrobiia bacterium]|nr:hypothetical protein [Acidimicrobiia bacterium]